MVPDPLQHTGLTPEWISDNDEETEVYAQGYGSGYNVIFIFKRNLDRGLTSLANRIVTCYHDSDSDNREDMEDIDEQFTFANRSAMREQLWKAVHEIWPQVIQNEHDLKKVGSVIDIDAAFMKETGFGPVEWHVYAHPLFSTFLRCLSEVQEGQIWLEAKKDIVEYTSLIRLEQLGGRGSSTKVQLKTGIEHAPFQVFKGLDFRTFLTNFDGKDGVLFKEMASVWHRSNNLVTTLPPHPNIMPPPTTLVVIIDGTSPIVCGCLYPFFPKGDLGDRLEAAYSSATKIPLDMKKSWCAQMVAAVKHAHYVGRTYHMDIKPGNFLISDEDSLVLIDWEQSDGPPTTVAPEADGQWEVYEEQHSTDMSIPGGSGTTVLKYTKYQGPERENTSFPGHPWITFNVFPLWNVICPKAVEKAEVFALGRSMWMVLRQPNMEWEEIEHPNDLVSDWNETDDIPVAWKNLVDRCMSSDPNSRPDMAELDSLIALWDC